MSFLSLFRPLEPLARPFAHLFWRVSRGLTLGVRALVLDEKGRIFLVQHSYVAGWHLPGGGVEPGETLVTALTRELREEGNIELSKTPELYGIYFNPKASARDHVALFVVDHFRQPSPPKPGHEIVAHGFFAPDALPQGTSASTRARIDEVMNGKRSAQRW